MAAGYRVKEYQKGSMSAVRIDSDICAEAKK
jgi:hypothetical protein